MLSPGQKERLRQGRDFEESGFEADREKCIAGIGDGLLILDYKGEGPWLGYIRAIDKTWGYINTLPVEGKGHVFQPDEFNGYVKMGNGRIIKDLRDYNEQDQASILARIKSDIANGLDPLITDLTDLGPDPVLRRQRIDTAKTKRPKKTV